MPYSVRTDNFNRANGYLTSDGWSRVSPLPRLYISSNQIRAGHEYGAGYWCAAYWSGDTFGDRQFSQFQIVDADYALSIVPFVRGQLASPGTCYGFGYGGNIVVDLYDLENDDGMVSLLVLGRVSYYEGAQPGTEVGVFQVGGGSTVYTGNYRLFSKFKLEKYVEGVQTVIAEYLLDAGILMDGIVIGLKSEGTKLTPYIGGNYLDPVTDDSLSGGIVGIAIWDYTAYTSYLADNWVGGGDLSTAELSGFLGVPKFSCSGLASATTGCNIMGVPKFSLASITGLNGNIDLTFPQLEVTGNISLGGGIAISLPQFTTSITGYVPNIGSISVVLPSFELDLTGTLDDVGNLALNLPLFSIDATGYIVDSGDIELTLPLFEISSTGHTEVNSDLALSLPVFTTYITGKLTDTYDDLILRHCYDTWGELELELPLFTISGSGTVA